MSETVKKYHYKVLIVDDEKDICDLMKIILNQMEISVVLANTRQEALAILAEKTLDFCITDFKLPDGSGLDILQWVKEKQPHLPVAIFTAYGSVDLATKALKEGAYDFVTKPVNVEMVRRLVTQALELKKLTPQSISPRDIIIGQSPAIQALLAMVDKVVTSQAPVLVVGPSGSGKELIARRIHVSSIRKKGPFIAVNCGAIPDELLESEFFGYKKGAFTGANMDKKGLFQLANGGVLFLDEIAELPLPMQVKLLRVIQEKSVRPIGGQEEEMLDIRLISATNQNLSKLVSQGRFREDLFYRLHVIELTVPPLRGRKEDIPLLVSFLINKICQQWNRPVVTIEKEALLLLLAYDFPGNVRELENILERAITLCDNDAINKKDLHLPTEEEMLNMDEESTGLEYVVNDMEKKTIETVLLRYNGNKQKTAKELGISVRSLRYRLKKLNIE